MKETNSRLFPEVFEDVIETTDSNRRNALYYPLLKRCLENAESGKSVARFISQLGISRIGLYAINEFMDYVLTDKSLTLLSEVIIYDRDYMKYDQLYLSRRVYSFDNAVEDYIASKIDKLIICNLMYADAIFRDFVSKGIKREDILTIDALVYWMK